MPVCDANTNDSNFKVPESLLNFTATMWCLGVKNVMSSFCCNRLLNCPNCTACETNNVIYHCSVPPFWAPYRALVYGKYYIQKFFPQRFVFIHLKEWQRQAWAEKVLSYLLNWANGWPGGSKEPSDLSSSPTGVTTSLILRPFFTSFQIHYQEARLNVEIGHDHRHTGKGCKYLKCWLDSRHSQGPPALQNLLPSSIPSEMDLWVHEMTFLVIFL